MYFWYIWQTYSTRYNKKELTKVKEQERTNRFFVHFNIYPYFPPSLGNFRFILSKNKFKGINVLIRGFFPYSGLVLNTVRFLKRFCSAYTLYIFAIYLSLCTQSAGRTFFSKSAVCFCKNHNNQIENCVSLCYLEEKYKLNFPFIETFDLSLDKEQFLILHHKYTAKLNKNNY